VEDSRQLGSVQNRISAGQRSLKDIMFSPLSSILTRLAAAAAR